MDIDTDALRIRYGLPCYHDDYPLWRDFSAALDEVDRLRAALASPAAGYEFWYHRAVAAEAENADLRARLDLMTRESRLSREATDRAVARLAENEVAFRKMAEAAEAYSREMHKARADRDAWQRDFQAQFDRAEAAETKLARVSLILDWMGENNDDAEYDLVIVALNNILEGGGRD